MNTLSENDLVLLVVGLAMIATCVTFFLSSAKLIWKLALLIVGFFGVFLVYHTIPARLLHLRIGLLLAIFTIVVGALLFRTHKMVGALSIVIGILAFVAGGYWTDQIPVIHISLAYIWNTGWDMIKEVLGQSNRGLQHLNQK